MKYIFLSIGLLILVLIAATVIGFIIKPVTWTFSRLMIWPVLILAGACGVAFVVNACKWGKN